EIKNGTVKALAVTWDKRIPQLPDVPTTKDAGIGQVDATTWIGIAFPAGTPAPIVSKVNVAMNQALQQPQVARRLVELGYFAEGGSPEQHTRTVASELKLWSKIYPDAGSPGLQ
uniref:Bug family tripartite tricarboxylate transporter substrate binding protein n=1 Tax=Klebsiella pneumoniae TaxID=573 RepID=UPI0021571709